MRKNITRVIGVLTMALISSFCFGYSGACQGFYTDIEDWVNEGLIPKPTINYQADFFSWEPIEE